MIVESIHRGRTLKIVHIAEVTPEDSDTELVNLALAATGETRSSTFDQRVARFSLTPDVVSVYLDID